MHTAGFVQNQPKKKERRKKKLLNAEQSTSCFLSPCHERNHSYQPPAVAALKTQSCVIERCMGQVKEAFLWQKQRKWVLVWKWHSLTGWGWGDQNQKYTAVKLWTIGRITATETWLLWKSAARRTSCCRSFIGSPGGDFTRASWCSIFCYCFSYIIVPPTCRHSNCQGKRRRQGGG